MNYERFNITSNKVLIGGQTIAWFYGGCSYVIIRIVFRMYKLKSRNIKICQFSELQPTDLVVCKLVSFIEIPTLYVGGSVPKLSSLVSISCQVRLILFYVIGGIRADGSPDV